MPPAASLTQKSLSNLSSLLTAYSISSAYLIHQSTPTTTFTTLIWGIGEVNKSRYSILDRSIPISPLSMQPALAPAPHPSMQNPAQVSNASSTRLSSDRSSRADVHLSDGRMAIMEMHPPHGNGVGDDVASQCASHRAASFRVSRSLSGYFVLTYLS
jgi:hypothetical protein